MWKRLSDIRIPLLLIYGRNDGQHHRVRNEAQGAFAAAQTAHRARLQARRPVGRQAGRGAPRLRLPEELSDQRLLAFVSSRRPTQA